MVLGVQIRLLVTLEGKVINFGQFWSDPSMQEEFAEPALYVKSGYLEVSIFLQDARWICFTRLTTWFFLLVPKKREYIQKHCQESCIEGNYIRLLVDINGLDNLM